MLICHSGIEERNIRNLVLGDRLWVMGLWVTGLRGDNCTYAFILVPSVETVRVWPPALYVMPILPRLCCIRLFSLL